jgi:hypothetical protein
VERVAIFTPQFSFYLMQIEERVLFPADVPSISILLAALLLALHCLETKESQAQQLASPFFVVVAEGNSLETFSA